MASFCYLAKNNHVIQVNTRFRVITGCFESGSQGKGLAVVLPPS